MIVINTQGVVLRTMKYKENDIILTLLTRQYGKVTAIARGAQRQKSKFLAGSQLFSYNTYTLKKQKDMFVVYQCENIKSFYNISSDFEAFSYATFIVKLVENNSIEGQTNNRLFELLVHTLFLYSEKADNKMFLLDAFILKFIDFIGYRPNVDKCSICSRNSYEYALFSIGSGGIVCNHCIDKDDKYFNIDQTIVSLMQYILATEIVDCSKAQVANVLVEQLYSLLKMYLIHYFDNTSFKSIDMFKGIK
ncbi:DNA repair protein RecO [Peptostreptococcus equinus]|uniref:DNA repair protein RecO n=1 Tax=Peptostreptococcus equinus TaxID=3003601 RepID=A0ABY7JQC4_9FIRM|nr:DNA repair protein RecO [Peptostreptococcus sp. CBA3647]WAW14175.1 DNA repair protein RecO [Peptostreptococcus sp. CBA3647]